MGCYSGVPESSLSHTPSLDPWIGGPNTGEADGDLLASRLVTGLWPFWGLAVQSWESRKGV